MRLYMDYWSFGRDVEGVMPQPAEPFEMLTDCPFTELGDEPFKKTTVRTVTVTGHDNNKYADVILPNGVTTTVKWGYLFREIGPKIGQE